MKGLILKDFFALKKQGKTFLVLFIFYLLFSYMTKNISMLGMMIVLICAMMPITTMSFDELCKWDKYALSMPVSRKTIVLSKYIFGILFNFAGIIIVAPISAVMVIITQEMKVGDSLLMILAMEGIAITFLAFIMPILFKFGVEKGRMLMLLVIFLPTMMFFLLSKLGIELPSEQTLKLLTYLSPIVVIIFLLFSICISIKIYDKKEF